MGPVGNGMSHKWLGVIATLLIQPERGCFHGLTTQINALGRWAQGPKPMLLARCSPYAGIGWRGNPANFHRAFLVQRQLTPFNWRFTSRRCGFNKICVPGSCWLVYGHLDSGNSSSSLRKIKKDTEVQVIWKSEVSSLPSEVDNDVPWHSRPVSSDTHLRRKETGCRFTSRHALRPISLFLSMDCNSIMS